MIIERRHFETREEAESFRDSYLRSYSPLGYGTTVDINALDPPLPQGDKMMLFEARCERAASCD